MPKLPQLPVGAVQNKLLTTGQNLGVNLFDQQGSTRVLYDSVPLDGQQVANFFKNPNFAVNALGDVIGSNVDGQNGLLGIGEGLAIEYIHFTYMQYDPATKTVTKFLPIGASGIAGLASGFYAGNFAMLIENQQVMKPLACSVFDPNFNATPLGTATPAIFRFMTNLTIFELLKFQVQLNLPAYTATANGWLRCTIQGRGGIYSAQTTY